MLWILLTVVAAPLQVARNVMQRGLVGDAGPWGATLVRFLFGLPFSIAIFVTVGVLTPDAAPDVSTRFLLAGSVGSVTQVGATASLLLAMRSSGFGVATLMQQSSLPLAALFGWLAFDDALAPVGWAGIAATTVGLVVLSWPERGRAHSGRGAVLGLAAGVTFAVTLNAYRQASLALDAGHPIYSAVGTVCVAQGLQSLGLTAILAVVRPQALRAVAASWRASLGAGIFGAAASACWFSALALAPGGQVRAVGVVEAPIAAAVGRRLFKERLTIRQLAGGVLAALGVVATALG